MAYLQPVQLAMWTSQYGTDTGTLEQWGTQGENIMLLLQTILHITCSY